MRFYRKIVLVGFSLLSFIGCNKHGEGVYRMAAHEREKFPEAYYKLDSLHVVYSDSLVTDTFAFFGDTVETFLMPSSRGAESVYMYETMRKRFESPDKKQRIEILFSAHGNDEGFPPCGGFFVTAFKYRYPVCFDEIKLVDSDQVVPIYSPYWAVPSDTMVFNLKTGIKQIRVTQGKPSYTITFYE